MTPPVGRRKPIIKFIKVDLPEPDGPTNAIILPGVAVKEIPESEGLWFVEYVYSTSLNAIFPATASTFFFP